MLLPFFSFIAFECVNYKHNGRIQVFTGKCYERLLIASGESKMCAEESLTTYKIYQSMTRLNEWKFLKKKSLFVL